MAVDGPVIRIGNVVYSFSMTTLRYNRGTAQPLRKQRSYQTGHHSLSNSERCESFTGDVKRLGGGVL